MAPLTGKVAVVTGGSRGIGLAVARALLERGADVAITGTSADNLRTAQADLQRTAADRHVLALRADVRRYEEVEEAIGAVASRLGGIDILVNNAGVGIFRRVADMARKDWHTVIDTNLTGVFHCCHATLPHLKARGGGWIVNVSSLASTNPFQEAAAYCASKAGLNAFSEALMQEVRHDGVRVAYVMPGSVRTEFSGRSPGDDQWKLAPEDVAQVVTDLIAHPSRSLPSRVEIRPSRPPKKR
ncbi:MAG: SDR family oxidoreductase [Acidimicrobiia bacterium]|nr:SDR family oxidoreductase [Acidimicrobiia bacterium]